MTRQMSERTTHPTETDLALYAGGDLGWLRQWRMDLHVRRCSQCQQTSREYSELRQIRNLPPELNWNRLAMEMKANIRLGLSAGECVGFRPAPKSIVSGQRLVFTGAVLTVLVATGAWVGRSSFRPDLRQALFQRTMTGTVLEGSGSGIQVRGSRQTLRILNPTAMNVVYSVGAQGELRARSLDPETGNVAITHVYGE